ncbi:uncharacterized protein TNCT_422711 [Trichonephila clavata]|uniref:Pre-C2HC domain-containing protein n=1 Tax=Trichonephila clavata TaxID=2740835 RepID=A0A8X6F8Q5_TRICU|nr:uncharacterized protein TNCT_422711 [Trichonephila clavata]
MEFQDEVRSVDMEDVDASTLTDDQICFTILDYETKIKIYNARKTYVAKMILMENEFNGEMTETAKKLEEKATSIAEKIASLEENVDVEDVTPAAPKIVVRPIMMKLFPEYNLILQELHRTYPSATNTHTAGYIKIHLDSKDQHQEITDYLISKKVQHYVTDPPANRPLKLVIKGLLASTDPEDIKKDLINQGIKILKIAQLKKFKIKDPLPIFMIEVARDVKMSMTFSKFGAASTCKLKCIRSTGVTE